MVFHLNSHNFSTRILRKGGLGVSDLRHNWRHSSLRTPSSWVIMASFTPSTPSTALAMDTGWPPRRALAIFPSGSPSTLEKDAGRDGVLTVTYTSHDNGQLCLVIVLTVTLFLWRGVFRGGVFSWATVCIHVCCVTLHCGASISLLPALQLCTVEERASGVARGVLSLCLWPPVASLTIAPGAGSKFSCCNPMPLSLTPSDDTVNNLLSFYSAGCGYFEGWLCVFCNRYSGTFK